MQWNADEAIPNALFEMKPLMTHEAGCAQLFSVVKGLRFAKFAKPFSYLQQSCAACCLCGNMYKEL